MGLLHDFIGRADASQARALTLLRHVVAHADAAGWVDRTRLSPDAAPSAGVEPLLEAGVLQLAPADGAETEPAGAVVRLSPSARAELLEEEIRDGRQRLLHAIDLRLAALSGAAPGHATTTAPVGTNATPALSAAPTSSRAPTPFAAPPAARNGASTLSSRGLVKIYKKRRVVNEVDLHLEQGEIVGLLGPNGAGKTTTFYMVVGLIKPDSGRVFLGSEDVTSVPMYRRARRGIGYLAQEPSIFRKLTVEENILAVLQMMRLSRREQRERLERLLDELGIKHLRHTKAYALSGGERRRLEITRALVGNPKFMLLDEPFAGVDPIAVHDIQQIVADLRRRGIGVLISDHNVEQTLDIVDRAYIMYDGRVRVSGTVSELVWNDEVAEIYLGPTLTARMRQRYSPPSEGAG